MFGTVIGVILTLIVVGGATGAAMYQVLDRSDSTTTENGAVVEPIYGSPSPGPTEEAEAPAMQGGMRQQQTQEPTTIIVVPRHTASPTPFEEEPTDTPELDEETHDEPTDEPTPE